MASPSDASTGKGSYAARLATFEQAHQLSTRRASSTGGGRKKKVKNVVEWPHDKPSGEDLARAGFFYRPTQESNDNVQCYYCEIKLDGWEAEDNAVKEHQSHAPHCAWAMCVSAGRQDEEPEEARDPMSEAMVAARTFTFTLRDAWVHQSKRGWKCKIGRMADAGWVFDPSPDTEDGVTCMHCNLSLDGWEPKDDPAEEHRKRSPHCQFFRLVERYHEVNLKKQSTGRSSSASKTSRLSAQSARSTVSDMPILGGPRSSDFPAEADDSIITTASTATAKGGKKKGKSAKAGKTSKVGVTVPAEDSVSSSYPYLQTSQIDVVIESQIEEQSAVKPMRSVRQHSKLPDSSAVSSNVPKAGNPVRGQKAKGEGLRTPEAEPEARFSDASAQLQEELEVSLSHIDESTPEPAREARGVKRTSDGLPKESERDSSVMSIKFPVPPPPAVNNKRIRKARQSREEAVAGKDVASEEPVQPPGIAVDSDGDSRMAQPMSPKAAKPAKTKKAAANRTKGNKNSSARSSKATITAPSPDPENYLAEDMARDEMEIETELQRIAAEQASAVEAEQERDSEFEASPSHAQRHVDRIYELEMELQNENLAVPNPSLNMANFIATVAEKPLPRPVDDERRLTTPSPSSSDKENKPSSAAQQAVSPQPTNWMASKNTLRILLASGTPNRSPAKQTSQSPSKHISNLSSSHPWVPIDLDAVLLGSPQPTPNTLARRLANAAGVLRSPEKGLDIEGWIRHRADRGEEQLRQRCEEMVGTFEREGMRALRTLDGLVTS